MTQDESGERLRVEARFLLDGTGGPELSFLDSELLLPPTSHEDCMLAAAAGGGAAGSRGGPGWVAGACLLGLGVATVVVAITVFKSRRRGAGASAGGLRDMMRFRRRGRRGVGGGASNTGTDRRKTERRYQICCYLFLSCSFAYFTRTSLGNSDIRSTKN